MMKRIAVLLLLFVVILAGAAGFVYQQLHKPIAIEKTTLLDVLYGDSIYKIAYKLKDKSIIEYPRVLIWYARVFDKARHIKAGEYELEPDMSMKDVLEKIISADVVQYKVTLIEGWTLKQALEALHASEALVKTLDYNHSDILKAVSADKKYEHVEGLFYPDTYSYVKGMKDRDILKRAYQRMQSSIDEVWNKRQKNLPYKTPYEMLIMASIIEKETAVGAERKQIAGVFVDRLRRGMRLQTDPTVIYGMGERYKGNIRRKDLREPTAYNTYVIKALPPTPIALPTLASIEAAADPLVNGKLYFVGKGDGYHYFSTTLKEHQEAVRKYQLTRKKNYRSSPKK